MSNAKKLPKSSLNVKKASRYVNAFLIVLFSLVFTVSCSSNPRSAPISSVSQPGSPKISRHIVAKGDTLYAIAWRYNLDYKNLSKINRIGPPYAISPGQVIRLKGVAPRIPYSAKANTKSTKPKAQVAKPKPSKSQPDKPKSSKNPVVKRSEKRTKKPLVVKTPTVKSSSLVWRWPVKGRVVSRFNAGKGLNKGIDIAAKLGESVRAAADGEVVYAGSGLRGYGNLIIVKHKNSYLSAYAHNSKLLAKEGDSVKRSEKIAEVGGSGTTAVKLHFEIRRDGVPVDPLKYLPR